VESALEAVELVESAEAAEFAEEEAADLGQRASRDVDLGRRK